MISCVYCGGQHDRPVDVKRCWSEHEQAGSGVTHAAEVPPEYLVEQPVGATGRRVQAAPSSSVMVPVRRGPVALCRHVLVAPNSDVPVGWEGCERITVGDAALNDPAGAIAQLRSASTSGESRVIEVPADVDLDALIDGADSREPFVAGVGHTCRRDELRWLLTSNAIDARRPERPVWSLVDEAVARGSEPAGPGAAGDVVTPDGRPIWLLGGPYRHEPPIDGVDVVHGVHIEHGSFEAPRSNDTAADLADDQLAAVTHTGGAARIIAPAGSGKTRVLTERARQLLNQWRVPPSALTLVAFNKRAQEEMRERTADLPGLHVRTLNAIALAIVNGTAPFAPQRRTWRTIDEPDVRRILAKLVQTPRKLNIDPIATWLDALSLVRLGLVAPAEAEPRYGGDVDGLAEVWPHFRTALTREGAVDFDDQIYRAIEVLLTQPEARSVAQRACRLMLVDEFQDLTPAHLLLVRLLAAPGGAVFGVGDDDQTIYGYNGADPAWLIDFATWFPGAASHPLEVNYRCPAGVVDGVDRLLRHNRRRVDKTIRAASSDVGGWSIAEGGELAVDAALKAVQERISAGVVPSDIAVLTRVNSVLAPVQVGLVEAGVAISGGVGAEFMERTAIRAALAWMRLADGSAFSESDLGEAVRRPSRGLSPRLRDWVSEQRDINGLSRLAARLNNDRDTAKVDEFVADLERLRGVVRRGQPTSDVVDVLCNQIGLGGAVATLDGGRRGTNRSAQSDDLTALAQLAGLHPDVRTFQRWLRDRLMARRSSEGVVLSTVHRVKGQEWDHVVVHLADADQYPHRLSEDREEERRLLHVAITRCRRTATIVTGESPSPFLSELTTEPPEHLPDEPPARHVRGAPSATSGSGGRDHPLLDRSSVFAVVGLTLVDQGQEWDIVDIEPAAVVARRGESTRRFAVGAKIETIGRQRGKLAARPGEVLDASVIAFDRLRLLRDRVRDGKPAYTVFDDKTLAGIASALPADLGELSQVKGVGPAKLEQYGDEVLAVVAGVSTSD